MPKGDRTGPMAAGPRTGRAAGFCAGYSKPGVANAPISGDRGTGRGAYRRHRTNPATGGGGWRNRHFSGYRRDRRHFGEYAPPVPSDDPGVEKEALEKRRQVLQSELDAITRYLKEMDEPAA